MKVTSSLYENLLLGIQQQEEKPNKVVPCISKKIFNVVVSYVWAGMVGAVSKISAF